MKTTSSLFFKFAIIFIILLLSTSCDYLEALSSQEENSDITTNPKQAQIPRIADEEDVKGGLAESDLSYNGKKITLTKHARCRMDCRDIDVYEIQEIINKNQINQAKSTPKPAAGKCPTIAYEGKSRDNQQIRVILGTCDKPIIITVIDLKNDYNCSCN